MFIFRETEYRLRKVIMILGELKGKDGNGEDGSCRGECSLDHREGMDGGKGDDDRHDKEGDKNWKRRNKGKMERGFKGVEGWCWDALLRCVREED